MCEFAVVLLAFLVAGCRLLSGDVSLTLLEVGSLGGLVAAAWLLPAEKVNVKGSWTLKELAAFLCTKATWIADFLPLIESFWLRFWVKSLS